MILKGKLFCYRLITQDVCVSATFYCYNNQPLWHYNSFFSSRHITAGSLDLI